MSNAGNLIPATWSKPSEEDEAYVKSIPIGYRFSPLDYELIVFYLKRKVNKEPLPPNRIWTVNLYEYNPTYIIERIKDASLSDRAVKYWYFFTPRDRKYRNGSRPDRSAGDGYWKATGSNKKIKHKGEIVGFKTTLVFYLGKQKQKGKKTNWIMHEFVLSNTTPPPPRKRTSDGDMLLNDYVLCKIYEKGRDSDDHIEKVEVEDEELAEVEATETQIMQDNVIIPQQSDIDQLLQFQVDQNNGIIPPPLPQQSDIDQLLQFQVDDKDHYGFDMLQQQQQQQQPLTYDQTAFNYYSNTYFDATSTSGGGLSHVQYYPEINHLYAAGTYSSADQLPYFHEENYAFAGNSTSGTLSPLPEPYGDNPNFIFSDNPNFDNTTSSSEEAN